LLRPLTKGGDTITATTSSAGAIARHPLKRLEQESALLFQHDCSFFPCPASFPCALSQIHLSRSKEYCSCNGQQLQLQQSPAECSGKSTPSARVEGPVETLRWNIADEQQISRSRIQHFLLPNIAESCGPILLKGVVQHWPALQRWSLQWLAEHFSEQR
jgi:hypothetical protein